MKRKSVNNPEATKKKRKQQCEVLLDKSGTQRYQVVSPNEYVILDKDEHEMKSVASTLVPDSEDGNPIDWQSLFTTGNILHVHYNRSCSNLYPSGVQQNVIVTDMQENMPPDKWSTMNGLCFGGGQFSKLVLEAWCAAASTSLVLRHLVIFYSISGPTDIITLSTFVRSEAVQLESLYFRINGSFHSAQDLLCLEQFVQACVDHSTLKTLVMILHLTLTPDTVMLLIRIQTRLCANRRLQLLGQLSLLPLPVELNCLIAEYLYHVNMNESLSRTIVSQLINGNANQLVPILFQSVWNGDEGHLYVYPNYYSATEQEAYRCLYTMSTPRENFRVLRWHRISRQKFAL